MTRGRKVPRARVYQIPWTAAIEPAMLLSMTIRALPLAAALAVSACAANAPGMYADRLPAGRYNLAVGGMKCTVCARAIAAEWAKLPQVEKTVVDFDSGRAVVTVRLNQTLEIVDLRRALSRADDVANLGTRFGLGDIKYIP